MTGGRKSCRADGCKNLSMTVALVPARDPKNQERFAKIALCTEHTRRWLNHIEDGSEPMFELKPHTYERHVWRLAGRQDPST